MKEKVILWELDDLDLACVLDSKPPWNGFSQLSPPLWIPLSITEEAPAQPADSISREECSSSVVPEAAYLLHLAFFSFLIVVGFFNYSPQPLKRLT